MTEIANHFWVKEKLQSLDKENLEALTPDEMSQVSREAIEFGKKEKARAITIGVVAGLVALVAIPAVLIVGALVGSGLLIVAPDSVFYPLAASMVGLGAFGGFKGVQYLYYLYRDKVAERWQSGNDLQKYFIDVQQPPRA
jgi:hypothetical protein